MRLVLAGQRPSDKGLKSTQSGQMKVLPTLECERLGWGR